MNGGGEGGAGGISAAAGAGGIPVVNTPRVIECKGGGKVTVRRVTKTMRNAIMAAARVRIGDESVELGGLLVFQELLFRWGVTAAEDLRLEGRGVEFSTVKHPGLGEIAAPEVYEAVGDADTLTIIEAISPGSISGTQRKN